MPGIIACEIVYGFGQTAAYRLLKTGATDFATIKVPGTNRYIVPTAAVLRLLDLDDDTAAEPLESSSDDRHIGAGQMRLVTEPVTPPAARRRAG
jgi:hypothetical protein